MTKLSRPKLSIIIVSWNTAKLLMRCIKSLVSSIKYPVFSMEIIVVDNGSTDDSVEMIKKYLIHNTKYKIHLIENHSNLGFAKGNNISIKQAQGEYIMLLNSDTIVQPGAIKILIDFLDRSDYSQIAVSPLLLLSDGKPQTDYFMCFPNLWQVFLYHNPILRPIAMKIPFLSSLIAQKGNSFPFRVDQLPGAALMAQRRVWEKVGLLDEDYHFLFEDVDWCWRARQKGVQLIVIPQAKIVHLGGASWKKKLKENSIDFYYQFFSSMLLFVRKNYFSVSAQIFKWAIILNFILTFKPKLSWEFFRNNGRQKGFLYIK